MSRFIKYFYMFVTALFVALTAYEVYVYMKVDSNYLGIFYLFLNFFVMFLLFTIAYNYNSGNRNIRVSKNIVAIVIGVIASFVLSWILPLVFNYKDDSYLFSDSIYVISKILKPIIYLLLGAVSIIEVKKVK